MSRKAAAASSSVHAHPSLPTRPFHLLIPLTFLCLFLFPLLLCQCCQQPQQQQRQHHHLYYLLQPYLLHPMAAAAANQSIHQTRPLEQIAVDYTPDACHHSPDTGEIRVTYDHRGGARWRSPRRFRHGTFGARIRCPDGDTSGLNFNIYLSSLEGDAAQDEIDFEFLGKDKTFVQTNYHVRGAGAREALHPLGFDASQGFHEYLIRWEEGAIEWVVDGAVVRRVERAAGDAWPEKPMYLYSSVWDASCIDEGRWAGQYSGTHAPYVCWYRDVMVPLHTMVVEADEEEDAGEGGNSGA